MPELLLPWLELAILVPFLGALVVHWVRDVHVARRVATSIAMLTLGLTFGGWLDFLRLRVFEARDYGDLTHALFHRDILVVDELTAPLLPLTAVIFLVTLLSTPLNKAQRFSFSQALVWESLTLTTFACRAGWTLVVLLIIASLIPSVELSRRRRRTRVFLWHMGVFSVLLIIGHGLFVLGEPPPYVRIVGISMLSAAALLRAGTFPVHCWMTDVFEKATFGSAILFVAPFTGALIVMRFVVPNAPDYILRWVVSASLVTSVYAAGMSLVQMEARRFFCFLLLSHSSMVLAGLELATPLGLCGGLSVWLAAGLSLTGFALVLRCVESRIGRVSLADYHGLFNQMPMLAGFLLLTGLASIGFPGTVGFIAMELLIGGVVDARPLVGTAIVLATALNGVAILSVWLKIFAGRSREPSVSLRVRPNERIAMLVLMLLILAGGLVPQPGVSSRFHASQELLEHRRRDCDPTVGVAYETPALTRDRVYENR